MNFKTSLSILKIITNKSSNFRGKTLIFFKEKSPQTIFSVLKIQKKSYNVTLFKISNENLNPNLAEGDQSQKVILKTKRL